MKFIIRGNVGETFKGKLCFPNQNLAMTFIILAKTVVFAIKFFVPLF